MLYRDQLLEKARRQAEDFICWREDEAISVTSRTLAIDDELFTIHEGLGSRMRLTVVAEYRNPLNVVAAMRRPLEEGEKWDSIKNWRKAKSDAKLVKQADEPKSRTQKDEKVLQVVTGWANNPHRNVKDIIAALLPNFNRLYLMFISDTELYGVTHEQFQRALEKLLELDEELMGKVRNRRYGIGKEEKVVRYDAQDSRTWIPALKSALKGLQAFESNGVPAWGKNDRDHREFLATAVAILKNITEKPEISRGFDQLLQQAKKIVETHGGTPQKETPVTPQPAPEAVKPEDVRAPVEEKPEPEAAPEKEADPEAEKDATPEDQKAGDRQAAKADDVMKAMEDSGDAAAKDDSSKAEGVADEWKQTTEALKQGLALLVKGTAKSRKGLYIWGAPGTGKTYDIETYLKRLRNRFGYTISVGKATSFASKKDCFEFLQKIKDKDLVLIDEAEAALNRTDLIDWWKVLLDLSEPRVVTYMGEKLEVKAKFVFVANTTNINNALQTRMREIRYELPFEQFVSKVRKTLKPQDFDLQPEQLEEVITLTAELLKDVPEKFNYRQIMNAIDLYRNFPDTWTKLLKDEIVNRKFEQKKRSNG